VSALQRIKLILAPLLYRALAPLFRFDPRCAGPRADRPVIYACLHRDIIPALLYVRSARPSLMVSESADGDILIRTLRREGFTFVRGSTGETGGRAFLRQLALLKRGINAGIAVDGPRGPFGNVHEGVIQMSKRSGAPIVPLRFRTGPKASLATWDRTIVPLPLTRTLVEEGEPLRVPAEATPAETAVWRDRLSVALNGPDGPRSLVWDRRSGLARRVLGAWRRWEKARSAWLDAAAAVTAPFVRGALGRRLRSRDVPGDSPFVVSVGNLAVGGTGKTPVTIDLAAGLAERGLRGAVVTRGYGSMGGAVVVDPGDERCGDEARLMAARLPEWMVVQAPRRRAGIDLALSARPDPDVIILEDGHQTAEVGRHCDILILDRWRDDGGVTKPETGRLIPWGPYREEASGAERARIWLLAGAGDPPAAPPGRVVRGFVRETSLPAGAALPDAAAYGVISGIARPEGFEADCARLAGRAPVLAVRADDHARYDAPFVRACLARGRRHGVEAWLTTAKDWVKLRPLWPRDIHLGVVELTLRWTGGGALSDLVREILDGRVARRDQERDGEGKC